MRVGILIPGNIESQPYLRYFTDLFDSLEIDYEYVCWDRDNKNPTMYNNHKVITIKYSASIKNSNFRKLIDYWIFSKIVKKKLPKLGYDFLIIHTIANAFFLKNYLIRNFNNKFIFDIRDYSPIYPLIKNSVKELIDYSVITTISSEGFLNWLPKVNKYLLSHNVAKGYLESQQCNKLIRNDEIKILTIGQLRNSISNKRIINSLGNKENVKLLFAGVGVEKFDLETFALGRYSNVTFTGRYEKVDEPLLVMSSDLINIVLPNNLSNTTPMSNRFYLSIVHRKPMIVNEESIQAYFVKKFNLGLIVKSEDDIYDKIMEYLEGFDYVTYDKGCSDLIEIIKSDIVNFENNIKNKLKK